MAASETRRAMLEKAMKEYNFQESALLEILHRAQEIYGYLSKDLLTDISQSLNLPPSTVFGVATFYSLFKLTEPGEHIVTGCLGTACYVRGVEEIIVLSLQKFLQCSVKFNYLKSIKNQKYKFNVHVNNVLT